MRPDAIDLVPKLVHFFDEPFADSSAIPSYYLSELARQHVTVALGGDGGSATAARDHTAGATNITPSAFNVGASADASARVGAADASAVSTTAPPMLSPSTKTGTPG